MVGFNIWLADVGCKVRGSGMKAKGMLGAGGCRLVDMLGAGGFLWCVLECARHAAGFFG